MNLICEVCLISLTQLLLKFNIISLDKNFIII